MDKIVKEFLALLVIGVNSLRLKSVPLRIGPNLEELHVKSPENQTDSQGKVKRKAMIRNKYNHIPHHTLKTKTFTKDTLSQSTEQFFPKQAVIQLPYL